MADLAVRVHVAVQNWSEEAHFRRAEWIVLGEGNRTDPVAVAIRGPVRASNHKLPEADVFLARQHSDAWVRRLHEAAHFPHEAPLSKKVKRRW